MKICIALCIGLLSIGANCLADPTYVLVTRGTKAWTASLSGHQTLADTLEAKVKKFMEGEGKNGQFPVPWAQVSTQLPAFSRVQVLTVAGLISMSPGATIHAAHGCSNIILDLPLQGKADKTAGDVALGIIGGSFPPSASLKPAAISKASADEKMIRAAVWQAILPKMQKDDDGLSSQFNSSHLNLIRMTKPGKGPWIVWMDQTAKRTSTPKHSEATIAFGFAALVDVDGKIVHMLVEPNWNAMGASSFEPLLVGDIDDDGSPEILGRSYYYEGASVVLVSWKKEKLEQRTLEFKGC